MTQRVNNLKQKFQSMANKTKNDSDRTVSSTYEWGVELLDLLGKSNPSHENILLNNVYVTIRDVFDARDESWQNTAACSTMMTDMRSAGVRVTASSKILPLPSSN